ncbi:N-acetylmuramoyl-L-alanine amidase [Sphaerisporangium sp. TRM90804]|uniref:peptidoglycan recognition protein family protein n=1 Tax=Sphaerisporangium sp. TRM90804 TaxID=3031113 RepID=UPI00244721AB|nr:N-acetylmuramoyl-L-alanine amidase [Sphaerisporangium sp. TRM90804]MDH2425796.1 N-acetylmuramoyl-L-alanine amidase [Sphaerisporangium sp. TRM90804]
MIHFVPREDWDARAPRGPYGQVTTNLGVKVHYTGGRVEPAIVDDHDLCVALVKSIQNFHMDGNGWSDIGYSLVACPHRKVFTGRGARALPAANGSGLNAGHYAVLGLVGTSGLVHPPDDLLRGLRDAIEYLRAEGGAGREIKGHRDGYATSCPGDALYDWIRKGAPRPGVKLPPTGPPPPPPWPGRLLRYPPVMKGPDVRIWQRAAHQLHGLALVQDGAYGSVSQEACQRIQRAAGLKVDGIVGPLTWAVTVQA